MWGTSLHHADKRRAMLCSVSEVFHTDNCNSDDDADWIGKEAKQNVSDIYKQEAKA
jgi:hypothetical protein